LKSNFPEIKEKLDIQVKEIASTKEEE